MAPIANAASAVIVDILLIIASFVKAPFGTLLPEREKGENGTTPPLATVSACIGHPAGGRDRLSQCRVRT